MYVQEFLFYGILVILVVRYLYICIKYPFWTHMPVYHTYDYHNFFSRTCREMQLFPYKNKFSNAIQIKTISYYELNDTYIKYFAELLQCFYIPADDILYTPVEKDVKARFSGHFDTPFLSFYNEKNYVSTGRSSEKQFDILSTNVEIQLFPEPKGCIASYPVHTFYHPTNNYKPANYLTYISVDRAYKSQNISRNLISTHDYNVRRHNPDVRIGLLKKDVGVCEGVVPLLTFSTGLFEINVSKTKQRVRNIVQVYRQNWDIMLDTLHGLFKPNVLYDLVVAIDIGAIKSRIDGEILFVYAFCEQGNVLAMYFIEDAHTLYEKGTEGPDRQGTQREGPDRQGTQREGPDRKGTQREGPDRKGTQRQRTEREGPQNKGIKLVASINNGLTEHLFFQGFLECLRKLQKRNLDFKMLLIDDIGHNQQLMTQLHLWTLKTHEMPKPIEQTTGAYYFINWMFPHTVLRERAFIMV